MSAFSSILSQLNGGQAPPPQRAPAPKPAAPRPVTQATSNGAAQNGIERTKTPVGQTTAPKRKADGDLSDGPSKVVKRDPAAPATSTSALNGKLVPPVTSKPQAATSNAKSLATNGSSNKVLTQTNPAAPRPVLKPALKPASAAPSSVQKPAPRPAQAAANTTISTPAAGGPLKKKSFAEIMARAKANSAAPPAVGVIRHKPVEKLTRKERLAREAEALAAAKNKPVPGKDGKLAQTGRSKSAEPLGKKPGDVSKEPKKATDLGYKGTMRANTESTYKGTMGRSAPARPSRTPPLRKPEVERKPAGPGARPAPQSKRYTYASYDEEDEEEEDDYESDLSDMEAGADELYEEEEMALKIAKKEDLEAQKEEDELKRQKMLRKNKLAQLVASRKDRGR